MANVYVYSGAAGAGTGADWANAYTTLTAAIAGAAAGDTYYVAHDHAESTASAVTLTFKGTAASPDRILCVNRGGTVPPVSADLRATATVTTTGTSGLNINGFFYCRGVIFNCGTGAGTSTLQFASTGSGTQRFEACAFNLVGTASAATFNWGGGVASSAIGLDFDNCTLSVADAGQGITLRKPAVWRNTASAITGATLPTTLFKAATEQGTVLLDGVDLSALGSGKTIVGALASSAYFEVRNCKLGASVTVAATPTAPHGAWTDLTVSDSGATGYRQERYRYQGTLTAETTIIRTGGASDGTTAISWKVATTADNEIYAPFECFPIAIWNAVTGSSKTLTVEIVNDGTTLTNAEAWLEVEYLGSSATPIVTRVSSAPADVLAAATNIPTSSETWTTTGLGSPIKQYLQVTFTPNMAGHVRAVVKIAKTSKTVYVCPRATLA